MKHGREDYQQIQDPHNKIGKDEPVFLLRSQDAFAPTAIKVWCALATAAGNSELSNEVWESVVMPMEEWQKVNSTKYPDAPSGEAVEAQEENPACDESDCHDCLHKDTCEYVGFPEYDYSCEHKLKFFRIIHIQRIPGNVYNMLIEVSPEKYTNILVTVDFMNTCSPRRNGYYVVNGKKKTCLSKEQMDAIS